MFHSGLAVFHSASSLSIGFHSSLFHFRCRSHIYIGITKYTSDYISQEESISESINRGKYETY